MIRLGFLVNPYAGMGGAVGLKGTDGCVEEARALGATQVSPGRAVRFLSSLKRTDIRFFTAGGEMGEKELASAGLSEAFVIYYPGQETAGYQTGPEDTVAACREMIKARVDLIVLVGGDGTARDVFSVTRDEIPMLGVPAGVKIYSGVFATTPESAAAVIDNWEKTRLSDAEVLDVDEEQYRSGILSTRLYGIARMPYIRDLCQSCKQVTFGDEERDRIEIGAFIVDVMQNDTLYLLGAGSTTGAIAERLGIGHTLLGVDAVYKGELVARDLNEAGILDLLSRYDQVNIIISPIGAQGFILGRGNQQISSRVLEIAGLNALIVVATPAKLQHTPVLYVDTGDPLLNEQFPDSIPVICGYQMAQRKPVRK